MQFIYMNIYIFMFICEIIHEICSEVDPRGGALGNTGYVPPLCFSSMKYNLHPTKNAMRF